MTTSPLPGGMTSVTPYLIEDGACEAIDFIKRSFDAVEISRQQAPGRGVMQSLIQIGDAVIEVSDSFPR
ncbi:hypothetical protein BH20CHL4_BH20CHL4_12180 [soil metagenome]